MNLGAPEYLFDAFFGFGNFMKNFDLMGFPKHLNGFFFSLLSVKVLHQQHLNTTKIHKNLRKIYISF